MKREFKAFTIVEVVIAISILAIIFVVAYRSVSQIAYSKTILDDEREVLQIANTLLSRMTREIQMAIDNNDSRLITSDLDRYKFYGSDESIGQGQDADMLAFMANEAGQYVPDGKTNTGVVQITYRVVKDPERQSNSDTYLLIRDEIPDIEPLERALEKRMTFPITSDLISLDFYYFDYQAGSWRREWKEENTLPALVRMRIQIMTPNGKVFTFATAVPILAGVY